MKRKLFWITTWTIAILLVADVVTSNYLYDMVIARGTKTFLQDNKDLEVSEETMQEFTEGDWKDWVKAQDFEEWTMTSADEIPLKGYYLSHEDAKKIAIFGHGYLGHGKQMGIYAQYYYEKLGYDIFMPDFRGHGQSGGDYYGFGWPDRLDLIDWLNKIIAEKGDDVEIVMHGLSMGASSILMAAGEDALPSQVKAIISDSAYTSVDDLFGYQMKRMYHAPRFPILPTLSMITELRAGYNLYEASALKQVEKADLPILFIAGDADTFVPAPMTKELYEAASHAELHYFSGANHGESIAMYREEYLKLVKDFLEKAVPAHGVIRKPILRITQPNQRLTSRTQTKSAYHSRHTKQLQTKKSPSHQREEENLIYTRTVSCSPYTVASPASFSYARCNFRVTAPTRPSATGTSSTRTIGITSDVELDKKSSSASAISSKLKASSTSSTPNSRQKPSTAIRTQPCKIRPSVGCV